MSGVLTPAETLLQAVARARSLRHTCVVAKLGGSAMEDATATQGMIESVAALQALGVRQVLVHGGGKPIDRAMEAAGIQPVKVQGRRYTDDATLAIVVRVLHDIMDGLDAEFEKRGAKSVGLEKSVLVGERLLLPGLDLQPIDLGRVGTVTRVDEPLLHRLLADGTIPIIPSLATDTVGVWLNVNADTAAAAVAGALKADTCLFLTDTPGVLRDRREPASLIPRLTVGECRELIATGVIDGGMIPKVEACFDALHAGAGRAVILDGRLRRSILDWFLGQPGGTEIVN